MLSIDGLVTGIDTTSIIEGLLGIQQRQIDTLNGRRTENLGKQTAFSGIEARLLSFRGSLGRLTSIQTTALKDKVVSSSNDTLVEAAASDDAAVGNYRLRVDRLAAAHQVATGGFESLDTEIGQGDFSIQIGDNDAVTITIDEQNNTVRGLVDAINASDAKVSASIVNDGSADNPFRVMLSSDDTGESNQISINSTLTGAADVTFDFDNPVEAAANAQIRFGTGDGAITVTSENNRVEDLVVGVTLNLNGADPDEEVVLTVQPDTEAGVEAAQSLVTAYNDFVGFVNDQVRFNAETQVGGPLLGERAVAEITDEISRALTAVIPGLNSETNRLTAVGFSLQNDGRLQLDESRLREVLSGNVEGVSADDVARLFALGADSSRSDFVFVVGSSLTQEGEVQVDVTQAAQAATLSSADKADGPIEITSDNATFSLTVDGVSSGNLTLTEGTYSGSDFLNHLESVINSSEALSGRGVTVSTDGDSIQITTDSTGGSSEVTLEDGSIWEAIGFSQNQSANGSDIQGHFIVDGVIEEATGRGNTLSGNEDNENTADLQVRVAMPASGITEGPEATLNITRGLASRLDKIINDIVDPVDGDLKTIDQRFEDIDASILASIERLTAAFESQQQSLISQFAALEGAVGELQTTGNFLASQFRGVSGLSV